MSETTTVTDDFIEELRWRGLLHQCTDEDALREHLESGPRLGYSGFDPTADSLTIGNLVPIMLLVHLARAGHTAVVLLGGGTGRIGDPSGKEAERALRSESEVDANVESQKEIFERVFSERNGLPAPVFVNNWDWLRGLGYIEALRDVGKHFSVNVMMQKESVKDRLENREQGISYTEFSYQILQAYDYHVLCRDRGVTLQVGGSDQWGNIVAGVELVRRMYFQDIADQGHEANKEAGEFATFYTSPEPSAFGLTAPLVTKADGTKFGKTEAGAVWLSPHRTSPYQLYQWCINAADDDVVRFLKLFTLLPKDEIEAIEKEHTENPGRRLAQTRFAEELVAFLHGREALAGAQAASKALFSGDVRGLDETTLGEVFAETPHTELPSSRLSAGVAIVDLLVETGLASSKREAREFLGAGSVAVSGAKVDPEHVVREQDLLPGQVTLLRRGKKKWHVIRWAAD